MRERGIAAFNAAMSTSHVTGQNKVGESLSDTNEKTGERPSKIRRLNNNVTDVAVSSKATTEMGRVEPKREGFHEIRAKRADVIVNNVSEIGDGVDETFSVAS